MKLYTEEQVRKAIDMARDRDMEYTKYGIFDELTPIELPSDEEIRFKSHDFIVHFRKETFFDGAKWMKEFIINQNK